MSDPSDPDETSPATAVRLALYGHLLSRALSTVAAMGVPDELGAGPADAASLAGRVGADTDALLRVLRALCAFGMFTEGTDGRFALTDTGSALRRDAPGSALPTALLAAAEIGEAWQALPEVVRTGEPAFPRLFKAPFFDHLTTHPKLRSVFDRSQEQGLHHEVEGIDTALDLGSVPAVVDVGGGDGALLAHLLRRHPHLRGVLVDLPDALDAAKKRLACEDLLDRCRLIPGDFFTNVPASPGVYVLRHILHDWGDEDCLRLLRTCRIHMPADARIAVIETEPGAASGPGGRLAAVMDLYMMTLFPGGRERRGTELGDLLTAAGFRLIGSTSLPMSLTVVHGAPNDVRPQRTEPLPDGRPTTT